MNMETLQEIEASIRDVPVLIDVPIMWGIDPASHQNVKTYPRIGVYTGHPQEREIFRHERRVAYELKISYYTALEKEWPTDMTTLAETHGKAGDMRKAVDNIYERQISGASSLIIDLDGSTEQEISVLDRICVVATMVTIVVTESV